MTLRRYSGRRDDLDPLVVRDGHEVVLDEVLRGPGASRRGRRSSASSKSPGWSALTRSMTVVLVAHPDRSRARPRRGRRAPRPAAASRARGSRRRRGRRRRAGRPARRGARGRSASRRSPPASVPSSQLAVQLDGDLGRVARPLEAALLGGRQRRRRRPRRSRRRTPAARRRSRARSAATAGPAARSPGSWPPRGTSAIASSRPAIASSRSASGAWSRANSRNRPSPMVSSASDRRSQMRSTSASKIARRTLWSSRSRSKRAVGGQAGRVDGLDRRRGGRGRRRARPRTASRPPSPSSSSSAWSPRAVPRTGLSRTQPAEARLDEVVERGRRAGPGRAPARGAGSGEAVEVGHWCERLLASLRRASRPVRRPARAGSGGARSAVARDAVAGSSRRAPRGSRRWSCRCRRRSRRSGSRPGPDRADTPPSATSRARSAARNAARSRSTRNSTKLVAHAARVERPVAPAGRSRRPRRCRPCRPAPRPGGGRWRGPRRGGRSCRPGRPAGRRARPPRGSRPGASRRRPACGPGAPAR